MSSIGVVDKFTLGPLLPNMEKRYWLLLDSALMQKVKEGRGQLFTTVYFSYEISWGGGRRQDMA